MDEISQKNSLNINELFELLNNLMYKEIDFFRCAAKDNKLSFFRNAFKNTISQLLRVDLKQEINETETNRLIIGDLTAVCIAYSYLDWLAGLYGDVPLSTVTAITKKMLAKQLTTIE